MQTQATDPIVVPWHWRRRGGLIVLEGRIGAATMHFTSRAGGVSPAPFDSLNLGRSVPDRADNVNENRRRLFDALAVDPGSVAMAQLVHGAEVAIVGGPAGRRLEGGLRPAHAPSVDALVTADRGAVLMMTYADCVPIFLVAPGRPACALAHAGWRGLAAGVVGAAVEALARLAEVAPGQLWAAVGPCIGPTYEVDAPVMDRMRLRHPWADRMQDAGGVFDMAGGCVEALADAGLKRERILVTAERTESPAFFSHRASHGRTGRMAGLLRLDATSI